MELRKREKERVAKAEPSAPRPPCVLLQPPITIIDVHPATEAASISKKTHEQQTACCCCSNCCCCRDIRHFLFLLYPSLTSAGFPCVFLFWVLSISGHKDVPFDKSLSSIVLQLLLSVPTSYLLCSFFLYLHSLFFSCLWIIRNSYSPTLLISQPTLFAVWFSSLLSVWRVQ